MSIQDSITIQLMAAVRTPEITLFCIFFNINSELKENKNKNKNFKGNDAPESKQNKETLSNPNP